VLAQQSPRQGAPQRCRGSASLMESGFAEDERHEIQSAAQLSKTGLKKPQNVTVHS
jgi:hypothetical protein